MLFFPIFTIELIKLCNTIVSVYEPLLILTFLLAHRAQITSATTGLLQKDKVLQLESIKWNSKQLANNPALKYLYAQIAIVSTIQFETNKLLEKTQEESAEILEQECKSLANEVKPKNARVLSNSALNEKNLQTHRHGKIAQCIGLVQARPIFEPSNIFKGISMSNITLQQLANLFIETAEKLGIQPEENSIWSTAYANAPHPQTAAQTAAEAVLSHYLQINKEDENTKIIFDDAILFGTNNNLLPLEEVLNVERPQRSKEEQQNIAPLTEEQQKNTFLLAAATQREQTLKEMNSRTKPGAKPKGTKTPVKETPQKEKGSRTRAASRRKPKQ